MKKAKEYFTELSALTTKTERSDYALEVLKEMVREVSEIAKMRNAKSEGALRAIILEQENKWIAFANLCNSIEGKALIIKKDGFYLSFCEVAPAAKRLFPERHPKAEIKKELKSVVKEQIEESIEPYIVTPLNEINEKNISGELLNLFYAMGSYAKAGFPLTALRPLAERIKLLEKWKVIGFKDKEKDIIEFENK